MKRWNNRNCFRHRIKHFKIIMMIRPLIINKWTFLFLSQQIQHLCGCIFDSVYLSGRRQHIKKYFTASNTTQANIFGRNAFKPKRRDWKVEWRKKERTDLLMKDEIHSKSLIVRANKITTFQNTVDSCVVIF